LLPLLGQLLGNAAVDLGLKLKPLDALPERLDPSSTLGTVERG
jgi:hypothetical protein